MGGLTGVELNQSYSRLLLGVTRQHHSFHEHWIMLQVMAAEVTAVVRVETSRAAATKR